jgi:hypothetical protein
MLLLHAVYATRPSKNILIYTTYVYACTLVAKYIEWRSGLANTYVPRSFPFVSKSYLLLLHLLTRHTGLR